MVSKSKRRRNAIAKAALAQQNKKQQQVVVVQQTPQKQKPKRKRSKKPSGGANGSNASRSGNDLLTTVNVTNGMNTGKVLTNMRIAPGSFPTTRFSREASLWSEWKVNSIRITGTASSPMTSGGTLAIGWTRDPSFAASGIQNPSLIASVYSMQPMAVVPLNGSKTFSINIPASEWLFIDHAEPAKMVHGSLIVIITSPLIGVTGTISVQISMNWNVTFRGPELIPTSVVDKIIRPDAGWYNLWTSSVDAYGSAFMCLKMSHGGEMAPFSSAQDGAIYTVNEGTSVPAYSADGTSIYVKYFTKVIGYSVPGFLCFLTEADARSYVKDHDTTKIMVFSKNGEYCKPSVPEFKYVALASSMAVGAVQNVSNLELRLANAEHALQRMLKMMEGLRPMLEQYGAPSPVLEDEYEEGYDETTTNVADRVLIKLVTELLSKVAESTKITKGIFKTLKLQNSVLERINAEQKQHSKGTVLDPVVIIGV